MAAEREPEIETDSEGRAFTTIAGVRVYIADEAECEAATLVVCGPVSHFPDDVHTICAVCQTGIVHRPHAPARPPKVCLTCASKLAAPRAES
jgi:hypothetical protein